MSDHTCIHHNDAARIRCTVCYCNKLELELESETRWAKEYADKAERLERECYRVNDENAKLHSQLDASCNAEEIRQVRAENARLSKIIHEAYIPLAKCFHGEWDECNVEQAYFVLKSA
jgi:hypothetical protein